jgi:hypothetical protein
MQVDLFTFVGLYDKALTTLSHLLKKGAEHAKAQGASEAEMLEWRLIDDMHPLRFQIGVAVNFSRSWPARVAGLEPPPELSMDGSLADIQGKIAEAKAYLAAIKPEQFAGRDDAALKVKLGDIMEPTLPAGQWLPNFATTNILFHVTIAYAILRSRGVQLGKADMFAGGL